MQLSKYAIEDLRKTLINLFGEEFCIAFDDDALQEIGDLLLTSLAESLKQKVRTNN